MSQSDYIQYKKTQQVLKNQTTLSKILSPNDYTRFQQYTVETTIPNTKLRYSKLIPSSTISVLEMEKTIANCPNFTMCKNTQNRPNRVKNTTSIPDPTYRFNKIYTPTLCTFTVGNYKTRVCSCSKTICKCRTTICENS
jgi:hypothetical protein